MEICGLILYDPGVDVILKAGQLNKSAITLPLGAKPVEAVAFYFPFDYNNVTLEIRYDDIGVNEAKLLVYKCSGWSFQTSTCLLDKWENVTDIHIDTVSNKVLINSRTLSAFVVAEAPSYCGDGSCDAGEERGGARECVQDCGRDCDGDGIKESWQCAEPACPVCPKPTPWSDCVAGKQTRTAYYCSAETNYECESYIEERSCEMPLCIPDGGSCTSNVDCCSGYCLNGICTTKIAKIKIEKCLDGVFLRSGDSKLTSVIIKNDGNVKLTNIKLIPPPIQDIDINVQPDKLDQLQPGQRFEFIVNITSIPAYCEVTKKCGSEQSIKLTITANETSINCFSVLTILETVEISGALQYEILNLNQTLIEKQRQGYNVTEAEGILDSARKECDAGNYENCSALINQTKDWLKTLAPLTKGWLETIFIFVIASTIGIIFIIFLILKFRKE